jgi:hypothetical protein
MGALLGKSAARADPLSAASAVRAKTNFFIFKSSRGQCADSHDVYSRFRPESCCWGGAHPAENGGKDVVKKGPKTLSIQGRGMKLVVRNPK